MNMKFSAKKMISRCKAEGKSDLLTDEIIKKIWELDGMIGTTNNWENAVKGEPLVWIAFNGSTGNLASSGTYVAECDCEYCEDC